MFAGSQDDLVVGLDLHMELVPMPAPTPMPFPMPFVGQVDVKPLETLIQFGLAPAVTFAFDSTPTGPVIVNGAHAAKTGDLAKNAKSLPHFVVPPGTGWAPVPKPPKQTPKPPPPPPDSPASPPGDAVLMTGSQTVYFEQCNATRLGTIAMSCSDPARLPSSNLLSVPKGAPVLVGGPPAFDSQAAAQPFFLRNKWEQPSPLHAAASSVSPGPRTRNLRSTSASTLTGHPVDVATGRVVTSAEDVRLDGPIPLVFARFYSSAWSERGSSLGHGWSHSLDERIWLERGKVVYKMGDGREVEFSCLDLPDRRMRVGDELFYAIDRLTLTRTANGFRVRAADGLVRSFERAPASDAVWLLLRIEDRAKHTVTFHYDDRGQLEQVETDDRWIRFEHRDRLLHRVAIQSPENDGWYDRVTFSYSPEGDLTRATDSQGKSRAYAYEAHLLVEEKDRDGVTFWFEYDGRDAEASCVRTWGDDGEGCDRLYFREITYDKKNRITFVENSFGHVTTYKMNVLTAVIEVADPHGARTKYSYDEHLWKTAEEGPLGDVTRSEYDRRGNETKRVLSNGATFTRSYDQEDRLVEMVDPRGERWTWSYFDPSQGTAADARPVARRTPTSSAHYRHAGDTTTATVDGRVFILERNRSGQIAKITFPNGAFEERWYDRQGRLVQTRDAAGRVRRVTYDTESRVVEVTEPGGIVRRWRYSGEGDVLEYADPTRQVTYGYRGYHRIAWREEGGERVEYRYTSEDDLIVVANEAGELHAFTRDACGRVVEEVGFDGRKHTYVRDAAGRVTTVFKPSKKAEKFAFDVLGQVTAITYADGTSEAFSYDVLGALETATNAAGTVRFERDGGGRVVRESFKDDWVASTYERGVRVQTKTSRGLSRRIERDAMNDVAAVALVDRGADPRSPPSWQIGFTRDELGREIARALPGGVTTHSLRAESGLPASTTVTRGTDVVAQTKYVWEGEGRLVAEWSAGYGNTTYAHDARSRLVGARDANGGLQFRAPGPTGNLFRNAERTDRRYGRGGVLLQGEGNRYRYDADGNLITRIAPDGGEWAYAWNANGTLAKVTRPDGAEVVFRYDALRRRIEKRGPKRSVGWIWDGDVPVHETVVRGGGVEKITWLFGAGTFAPLARIGGDGRRSTIVTDYLGVPTEMLDDAGRVTWKRRLDLFGSARLRAGEAGDCPWRWPGQYEDDETGLHYNRFRYYDPVRGDYISHDPLGLAGGMRAYGYVVDPLRWVDPLGLRSMLAGTTAAGAPASSVPGPPDDPIDAALGSALSGASPSGPTCDAGNSATQPFADSYGAAVVYSTKGRGGTPVGDPQVQASTQDSDDKAGCQK